MLQQEKLFGLSQLVSIEPGGSTRSYGKPRQSQTRIIDVAVSQLANHVALVTTSGKLLSLELNPEQTGSESRRDVRVRLRRLPWFQGEQLLPRCVTFSPENDFALIASYNGQLFVVSSKVLSPSFSAKGNT